MKRSRNRQFAFGQNPIDKRWTRSLVLGIFTLLAAANVAIAQKDFYPEHPAVKAMADKALQRLQKSGNGGHGAMAALAIVQHSKRYEQRIPKNNRTVEEAVNYILNKVSQGKMAEEREMYFPAIALILLAEVDSEKHEAAILEILAAMKDRQENHGGFTYATSRGTGDCSQTQFAALAMWVAKTHGFEVDLDMAQSTLNWLCRVSRQGRWSYMYGANGNPQAGPTLSMNAAGLSSVYLMADMLQLNKRVKDMQADSGSAQLGLPKSVRLFIPPREGRAGRVEGPLVKFDKGLLNSTISSGNSNLQNVFTFKYPKWNYYYLYAIERYAYFREQAEGDLGGGSIKTWYDDGVRFLKSRQADNGAFKKSTHSLQTVSTGNAFAILFLVRSSEIINVPPAEGPSIGGRGFGGGTLTLTNNATIASSSTEKNLNQMIDMLKDSDNLSSEQLKMINDNLKKQIVEFRNKDAKSRAEVQAFLRSMVGARNYYRRLIAVRFLAGEQDMDNVPGLIYAVTDPDLRIAFEAHQGLRLISRKIDSMKLSEETIANARRDPDILKKNAPESISRMRSEFKTMEKKWSQWFLRIRPDAELFFKSKSELEELVDE
jgi:hypothetical protein